MLTILIVALLGSGIGWLISDDWDRGINTTFGFLFGIAFGLIVSMLIALSVSGVHDVSRSNLKALNDGTTTTGSFFIGIGTINNHQVFSYYKQVGPNQYKLARLNTDVSGREVIVQEETNLKQPYVETTGTEYKGHGLWALPIENYDLKRAVFHVPKGSIKEGVTLDAQ